MEPTTLVEAYQQLVQKERQMARAQGRQTQFDAANNLGKVVAMKINAMETIDLVSKVSQPPVPCNNSSMKGQLGNEYRFYVPLEQYTARPPRTVGETVERRHDVWLAGYAFSELVKTRTEWQEGNSVVGMTKAVCVTLRWVGIAGGRWQLEHKATVMQTTTQTILKRGQLVEWEQLQ